MKSLKFTLALIGLIALGISSKAQLSGTYTIGGTSPNYPTLQDAINDMASVGINGAVVFNLRPGTYSGKVTMGGTIAGVSAVNTITIKSENNDSSSVILTDTSSGNAASNFTVLNNGIDYVTFRYLTIERSGTLANSTVMFIGGGSKFFSVKNCVITAATTTSTAVTKSLVTIPLGLIGDSSTTFTNNVFMGGSIALSIVGQSVASPLPLPVISDNVFINQSSRAIQMSNSNKPVIDRNIISTTSTASYRAINLNHALHAFSIQKNIITGVANGDIIYLDTCLGDVANEGLIANNFMQSQGTSSVRGFNVNRCASVHFYYNTVNLTTTGATNNAVFSMNNSGSSLLNVRNNIFVNTGGGMTFDIGAGTLGAFAASDRNDLFVGPSSSVLASFDTANYATLAAWQAGTSLDANSVSGDPHFFSATDLHVDNAVVNDNAAVIASVTTDIDGQTRSGTTPDIGADEFTPLSDNIGTLAIISPSTGICGDSNTVLGVIIVNSGLDPQSNFDIDADITGLVNTTLTETYTGTLTSNQTDTVYFAQTFNTYSGGMIDVTVYTSLSGDQYTQNDTVMGSFTFNGYPNAPSVVSPQQQCDNNVMLTATPDTGNTLAWYDQPTGGNLLYIGDVFNPSVSSDTTFYVEARTGSGSAGCLRITEIMPDDIPSDYIEIQNVSGAVLDATGWVVAASLDNSNSNSVNANLWQLGVMGPGEVRFRTDNATDTNYWGSNLLFTGGSRSWVMIIDNLGNIVDFVANEYPADSILNMHPIVNGFPITVGSEWTGPGYTSCSGNSNVRIGSSDHNDASDWSCEPGSPGVQNAGISSVFTNCGVGVCGSPRMAIDVQLVPGISVNLGNDTMIGSPFTLPLDAGAGFTTYNWSTGETTQTITVSSYGSYWVTVTGGPNNCSNSDTIVVSLNVNVNNLIGIDDISFYPNPASNRMVIYGKESIMRDADFRITDIHGAEVKSISWTKSSSDEIHLDTHSLNAGIYFLHVISGNKSGVQKFIIIR